MCAACLLLESLGNQLELGEPIGAWGSKSGTPDASASEHLECEPADSSADVRLREVYACKIGGVSPR